MNKKIKEMNNKEIKKIFELYEKNLKTPELKFITKTLKEYYFEKEDYLSRIEKAIEYIKEPKDLSVDSYYKFNELCESDDLLNILTGGDEE